MTDTSRNLEILKTPAVVAINTALQSEGYEVRFVGGCVRDALLRRTIKDIDLATTATPDEMIEVFKAHGINYIETGLKHGTLTVVLNHETIEITTLRIDRETDGRHADVEFVRDWKLDAARRDLTINALSANLTGQVFDYFDGINDLRARRIQFVGNTQDRINEDFLRILRFFRFHIRYSRSAYDSKVLNQIQESAAGLRGISGERIWSEMKQILASDFGSTIRTMSDCDVLSQIGFENGYYKDYNSIVTYDSTNDFLSKLAAMLYDEAHLLDLHSRWKFSGPEYRTLSFILKNRHIQPDLLEYLKLASKPNLSKDDAIRLATYHGRENLRIILNQTPEPTFPLTGQDLIDRGYPEGRIIGSQLAAARKYWEDHAFLHTKEDLLKWLGGVSR